MRASDAKLAAALREAGLEDMAQRAEQSYYNDFLSPLDTPILTLVRDLETMHTPQALALAERAKNGEFDADKEESDEWSASAVGQEAFGKLVEDKPAETKTSQAGRLAFRQEGHRWTCYYALPETLDDAVWMGSVAMGIVADPERKQMFVDLMRDALKAFFESKGAKDVEWETTRAPESERSGSA